MTSATVLALFTVSSAMARQAPSAPPPDPRTLGSIEGVTYGANHLPLPDTTVMLLGTVRAIPGGGGVFAPAYDAVSDSLGRFSFQGLPPGKYQFTANHADYSPYDMALVPGLLENAAKGSASVTVAAGQHVTNVELNLEPMTVLSGKVIDENGDPIPGVTVRPMRAESVLNGHVRLSNAGAGVKTGPDGKYQMTVYSGHWYLSFIPARVAPAKSDPAKPAATTADASP